MPPPTALRRATLLALAAALLGGCSGHAGGGGPAGASGLPTPSSVDNSRFVASIDLDNGGLTVSPPPATTPRLSAARAAAMFRATDAVQGTFPFSVFGLGLVTISSDVAPAPVTGSSTTTSAPGTAGAATTTTGTATTSAPTGNSTSSTSSTRANGTTTSATTTSAPSITIPGIVPGASTPLPIFEHRLAWVGIVWGARCLAGDSTSSTTAPAGTVDRYTAVVFDAQAGTDAIAYTSAGPPRCGAPASPPVVSSPAELVSVPWRPVGPASTAVHVSLPACATYYGWTQVTTSGTGTAVQVVARVPYASACATGPGDQVVDGVVPLGSAQSAVPHAALGPVDAERTLAGG